MSADIDKFHMFVINFHQGPAVTLFFTILTPIFCPRLVRYWFMVKFMRHSTVAVVQCDALMYRKGFCGDVVFEIFNMVYTIP